MTVSMKSKCPNKKMITQLAYLLIKLTVKFEIVTNRDLHFPFNNKKKRRDLHFPIIQ